MKQNIKISEFSRLSGISRKNLIYYDSIGLLSPAYVGDNGYRLYAYHQLDTVSVIEALREMGTPLKEIKDYLDRRTPDTLLTLFTLQKQLIEKKIRKLECIRSMIDTRLAITSQAFHVDFSKLQLQNCEEESLFISRPTKNSSNEALEKTIEEFYELFDSEQMTYGYPLGAMVLKENLKNETYRHPSHVFIKSPAEDGGKNRMMKPAGLYLVGYEEVSSYDTPLHIYPRMFQYIKEHGLSICGNSYEEYLLDEIAVMAPHNYIVQVSMQVDTGIDTGIDT